MEEYTSEYEASQVDVDDPQVEKKKPKKNNRMRQ